MSSSRIPAGAHSAGTVARAGRRDQPRARRVVGPGPAVDRHRLVARRIREPGRERHEVEDVVAVQVRDHDRVDARRSRHRAQLAEHAAAAVEQHADAADTTRYPLHALRRPARQGTCPAPSAPQRIGGATAQRQCAVQRGVRGRLPRARRATGESPIAGRSRRAARLAPAQSGTPRRPGGGAPAGTRTASGCGGRRPSGPSAGRSRTVCRARGAQSPFRLKKQSSQVTFRPLPRVSTPEPLSSPRPSQDGHSKAHPAASRKARSPQNAQTSCNPANTLQSDEKGRCLRRADSAPSVFFVSLPRGALTRCEFSSPACPATSAPRSSRACGRRPQRARLRPLARARRGRRRRARRHRGGRRASAAPASTARSTASRSPTT